MRRRGSFTPEERAANRRWAIGQIRKVNEEKISALQEMVSAMERAAALYPTATRPLAHEGADLVEDMGHGPRAADLIEDGPAILRDLLDALLAHQQVARRLAAGTEEALAREESGNNLDGD